MFVKVCGITNLEDGLAAAEAGARALGFIFYPPSPRAVTVDEVESFTSALPKSLWKVGVFVNEKPEIIRQIADRLQLDIAQLDLRTPQFLNPKTGEQEFKPATGSKIKVQFTTKRTAS